MNRKPLAGLVAELAEIHRVDVIILAECDDDPQTMLSALNRASATGFHFPRSLYERIVMFTRFSPEFLKPLFEGTRVSIRRLALPARMPVLFAATHLPSKLYCSPESLAFECSELARDIENVEDRAGHPGTLLVGDFNLNPFEAGLVGGLSSVMSRQVASRMTRIVQDREHRFFYNPMWGHFGDARTETAGSYFYDAAERVNHYWNIFDQVLLRPELAKRFDTSQLSICEVNRSFVARSGGWQARPVKRL